MLTPTQKLYSFLAACRGNWRNTIYIEERTSADHYGYLAALDSGAQPIVLSVDQFQEFSGQQIDPTECRAQMSSDAFSDIYCLWLCWQFSAPPQRPLQCLCHPQHLTSYHEKRSEICETT